MNILAIDCTQKIFSAAVKYDGKWLCRYFEDVNVPHSTNAIAAVNEILREVGLDLDAIDAFGCNVGPGSFTGIRIAISTLKGFNFGQNKKLLEVNTFELLAYNSDKADVFIPDNKGFFFAKTKNGLCLTEPTHISFEQKDMLPKENSIVFTQGNLSNTLAAVCDRKAAQGEFVEKFCPMYIRKSQAELNNG